MPGAVDRLQDTLRRAGPVAWVIALAALAWVTVWELAANASWYIGIDQFGYLTFAEDLVAGRVFHDWPPITALADIVPHPTDALGQTYVWDGAHLYSRYAPGFPLILAAWITALGRDTLVFVNPIAFALLLAVASRLYWNLSGSAWRAGAAAALLVLCPTQVHLWTLSVTRDLAVHLTAFTGLLLLAPQGAPTARPVRMALAGLALGYAVAIRPDAVLYLLAAVLLAGLDWRRTGTESAVARGRFVAVALGLIIGVTPLLVYDTLATGNPFVLTQGMEARGLFGSETVVPTPGSPDVGDADEAVAFPPAAWRGGSYEQVQGGALRLSNLSRTLPALTNRIRRAYGMPLLLLAALGVVGTLSRRPALGAAALLYGGLALAFYGCWPRPDVRYLTGLYVFVPMLVVEGAMLVAAGVNTLIAAKLPRDVVTESVAALGLAVLLAVAVTGPTPASAYRAGFGQREAHVSRMNVARLLEPDAVVITSEAVGRPVENIEYRVDDAHGLYLTDLTRWNVSLADAAAYLLAAGLRPYLFLPSNHPGRNVHLRVLKHRGFTVDTVAEISAGQAFRHFVATPQGLRTDMDLLRVDHPRIEVRTRRSSTAQ